MRPCERSLVFHSARATVVHAVDDVSDTILAPMDRCYVLRHALELYESTLAEVTGIPPTRAEFRSADGWLHRQLGLPPAPDVADAMNA